MKILFLDVDGVLNSRAYDRKRDWTKQTNLDETRLPLVKKILDATGAKIVLSSTWREDWEKDEALCGEDGKYLNETFARYGLVIFDKTPFLGLTAERKEEIKRYLASSREEIEAFAVLDDYRFGWGELSPFVVITNPNFGLGLEEEHANKAISLLRAKKN